MAVDNHHSLRKEWQMTRATRSSAAQRIGDLIDLDHWQTLLDDFALLTGISVVLMDTHCRPVTRQTLPHNTFCMELIKKSRFGGPLCHRCDRKWAAKAAEERTYQLYTCPCGLVDFVSPVTFGTTVLGYLFGGQVRACPEMGQGEYPLPGMADPECHMKRQRNYALPWARKERESCHGNSISEWPVGLV